MITITYNETSEAMILRAEGHAGFAPKGQDIVCAAVSTLMQTLAYSVDVGDGGAVAAMDQGGGRNVLTVQAAQGCDNNAKFEFAMDGLYLLAEQYPEHVRMINLHTNGTDNINLQLFAEGVDGTTTVNGTPSQSAGADSPPKGRANAATGAAAANGKGSGIELPALRPAEERLARRSGVLKRGASAAADGEETHGLNRAASDGDGMPSQSPDGDSSPNGRANASAEEAAEKQNEAEGQDGEEKGDGKAKTPEERRAAFRELMGVEYKDLAEEMMQRATNEAARRLEASPEMNDLMAALGEVYGTDAADLKQLAAAIRNGNVKDDAYYERLAMEKGVSTKTARELDKLESQNRQLTEQQQLIQQMERQRAQQARIAQMQAQWDKEAEALKAQYPFFDKAEVLANPEIEKLMLEQQLSMTNAFRLAYFDRIQDARDAATAQQVEQGVVNRMQQRNARPGENGTRPGGAVQTKIDVAHMSRREAEELEKRVARGEIITF